MLPAHTQPSCVPITGHKCIKGCCIFINSSTLSSDQNASCNVLELLSWGSIDTDCNPKILIKGEISVPFSSPQTKKGRRNLRVRVPGKAERVRERERLSATSTRSSVHVLASLWNRQDKRRLGRFRVRVTERIKMEGLGRLLGCPRISPSSPRGLAH